MLVLLVTFAVAVVCSVLATLWARRMGGRLGIVDHPDGHRRRHDRPVPRVGGVAIFVGAGAAMAVSAFIGVGSIAAAEGTRVGLTPLLVGATLMFGVGLLDDVRNLSAKTKFLAEALVALGLFALGLRIGAVDVGGSVHFSLPPVVDALLTVFWFVGLANAFNLIDGHDGVAGGVALLALATISYAAVANGNPAVAIPSLALSGAVLGFLLFNLPPASVFMGDAGSLFLGFCLAGLGLMAVRSHGADGAVPVLVPVLALGLPVLDTSLAIFRRFLRGDPVFRPDRGHIHHRLHDLGYPRSVVTLLMWGLAGIFSLVAVMLLPQDPLLTAVGLSLALTVSLVAVRWLETPEIAELGRAVQRAFIQRATIRQNVRLRDAVRLLDEAETPDDLHGALRHAFRDSACDHIELWVPSDWARVLGPHPAFASDSFGMAWRAGDQASRDFWEISVTLELDNPRAGRLSLRYGSEGGDSTDHVESIVGRLRPSLCGALDRLRRIDAGEEVPPARLPEEEAGSDRTRFRGPRGTS
ncbi:MAG TPA: MraY family glycosyltransferase [Longimicrobiales bacterium]|nr:MraY family glycosyltransferase [Longimicrobiales bacterium]